MGSLQKIGYFLDQRDERANQELARELATTSNTEGVAEIAANLWNKKESIRADCIKVLYEIGFLKPELITPYTHDFLKLISSRNNRLVWGAMYALACIAPLQADELFPHVREIEKATDNGSVITVDNGVKTLASIAADKPEYQTAILPYLLQHLEKCRLKEVPQHAESTCVAISGEFVNPFREILEKRLPEMTPTQSTRVKKLLKRLS